MSYRTDQTLRAENAYLRWRIAALEATLADGQPAPAVEQSAAFRQAVLDALPARIAVLDATSTIIRVNKAWLEFAAAHLPLPAAVAEGVNYLRVCDQATGEGSTEAHAFAAGLRAVLAGEQEQFSLEYPCHSLKEKFWFVGHITRFVVAEQVYLVVAHEDITQRKQIEAALNLAYANLEQWTRKHTDELAQLNQTLQAALAQDQQLQDALHEHEALYHAMFEHNRAVKLLIDPDTGAIVDANSAASDFYGYPRSRLRTMNIAQINVQPTEVTRSDMQHAKHERQRSFQFRHRLASGAIRDVEVYSGPVKFNGQILLFSIVHDITERCRIEGALRRAQEELELRVQERTVQLTRTNSSLQSEIIERQRAAEALGEREARYRIVSELMSDYAYAMRVASNGVITCEWVTDAYTRTTGYDLHETEQPDFWKQLIYLEDWPIALQRHQRLLAGQPDVSEFRIMTRSGEIRWLRDYGKPVWDDQAGRVVRIYGAAQDITERKQAEEALHLAQFALDCAADAVVWTDPNGQILYVKDVACIYHGFTHAEFLTRRITDIEPELSEEAWKYRWEQFKQQGMSATEAHIYRKDGSTMPVEITSNYLAFKGKEYLCSFIRDITERKATEEQLRYQALHDTLTDLPNRTLLLELLEHAMLRVQRDPSRRLAVLFLDLDNFKVINDSLGHLDGDHLLTLTVQRLKACLRASDTIARFGGDEFVILQEELDHPEDALALATRLQQALTIPFYINDHELLTSASIGIVISSGEYQHPAHLLRDADTAMYQAKAQGPGHYAIFDTAMHSSVVQRLDTENALRHAIDQQQLRLHYQPIVSLATGRVAGFEALVRWQHPQRGLIPPSEFIPIAEETGLIIPLGWWVLREACTQMCRWRTEFPKLQPLTIGVNLSSKTFMRSDVVEQIHQILQETGLDAASLKLEITENVMMDYVETTITTLTRLRNLGVKLCIDDFGTGYSSLRYLHRFPIQTLKIDRSFVRSLQIDDESTAITQSILMLGHMLRKEIIAEGIETPEQLRYLQNLHCEYGQGYLFSRPVDGATAATFLMTTFVVTGAGNAPGDAVLRRDRPPFYAMRGREQCQAVVAILQQRLEELERQLDACHRECETLRQSQNPFWTLTDTARLDVAYATTMPDQMMAVLRIWERTLAAVSTGIFITDARQPDMPIIYCNAAFECMTGYTPSETLGRNWRFLHGPETDPLVLETIHAAVQAATSCQVVVRTYRKDGRPIWNELTLNPITNAQGKLTHYVGILTDVTERKRMEDALQASEETFRGFFEQSQDGLILVNAEGQITAWNRGAAQIFGVPQPEAVGMPKWDILFRVTPEEYRTPAMHARLRTTTLEMIRTAGQGQAFEQRPLQRTTQAIDGTRRIVSTRIFPIQTNTGLLLGSITRDITQLKQTEAQIRASQAQFQAIFDNAAVGIALLNREGQFAEMNDRWIELLSMTRYEMYQTTYLDLTHPDDHTMSCTNLHHLLHHGGDSFRQEQRYRRKDGSFLWGDVSARALRTEQGDLEGVIAIVVDITERKQAEQSLQQMHVQLQARMGQLKERNQDITLLNELSDLLQNSQTIAEAYQVIAPVMSQLFAGHSGVLYTFDSTRTRLERVTTWGPPLPWSTTIHSSLCQALLCGVPHTTGLGHANVCCTRSGNDTIASLCVPLVAQNEYIGVLRLSEAGTRSLQVRRRLEHLAVTVADYLMLTLSNLQLRERLQEQAMRDALTGLFNRRYLDETLRRELQRAARHQHPVGVIMLDVDHFKQFNDRFGHKGGDALLKAVGAFLRQHIRGEDIACRYGGEEFLLILPDASLHDTHARAEEIQAGIKQLQVTHEDQTLATITISMGVASFPEHGPTSETLIDAVDSALYRAKATGRDRVVVAPVELITLSAQETM